MRQRIERLEGNMDGGQGCPECGGGGGGTVQFITHVHHEDECPTCGGPCRESGPEFCNSCGQLLRFTIKFDNHNNQEDEDGL